MSIKSSTICTCRSLPRVGTEPESNSAHHTHECRPAQTSTECHLPSLPNLSHIKNSFDFVHFVQALEFEGEEEMVSCDVTSIFTSGLTDIACEATKRRLEEEEMKRNSPKLAKTGRFSREITVQNVSLRQRVGRI